MIQLWPREDYVFYSAADPAAVTYTPVTDKSMIDHCGANNSIKHKKSMEKKKKKRLWSKKEKKTGVQSAGAAAEREEETC